MRPIINSILDSDMYKFTMQQAVLELFPNENVSYRFKNRGKQRFNVRFLELLKEQIDYMSQLALTHYEYSWIKGNIPFFKPMYLEYLRNYRFNPNEVECYLCDNDLVVNIQGSWHSTILWEVPLMAMISELYFKTMDTEWAGDMETVMDNQTSLAYEKHGRLIAARCTYADFSTRRRRSFANQENFLRIVSSSKDIYFVGTSNVFFAMQFGLKPIGTMAHEWFMGNSVLEGLRHANYRALDNWIRVYGADLGIALTDTYGSEAFFANFNKRLARDYDGVRHDSGDPLEFADKVINHYNKLGINPRTKVIIFSDGLNVDKAIEIKEYCEGKIQCSFGIGTHFSNDFEGSPALNMVIKLWDVNGVPVVKLSDNPIKVMGDPDAVAVAKWTFFDEPLLAINRV